MAKCWPRESEGQVSQVREILVDHIHLIDYSATKINHTIIFHSALFPRIVHTLFIAGSVIFDNNDIIPSLLPIFFIYIFPHCSETQNSKIHYNVRRCKWNVRCRGVVVFHTNVGLIIITCFGI